MSASNFAFAPDPQQHSFKVRETQMITFTHLLGDAGAADD